MKRKKNNLPQNAVVDRALPWYRRPLRIAAQHWNAEESRPGGAAEQWCRQGFKTAKTKMKNGFNVERIAFYPKCCEYTALAWGDKRFSSSIWDKTLLDGAAERLTILAMGF
ncbi:MAG: hypothetical protein KKG09_00935, partial [Verrucomicrobia bacterium]|nr:hypothetical protein [Verrucomicrobiota bacterium]MBU4428835.1 hypothetical protein [Verrucomicrobiota bacterium]MBU4496557.1 hypothetical protein [Verrucomicrobiota bacterium]MCG2680540.1 hypothetical protein [Kiritimatiellia bacterium]